MAEPMISVYQMNSGVWLVEPVGGLTRPEELRAFADIGDAAAYAVNLVEKHGLSAIILPPEQGGLNS
jgi:hypothetical protein